MLLTLSWITFSNALSLLLACISAALFWKLKYQQLYFNQEKHTLQQEIEKKQFFIDQNEKIHKQNEEHFTHLSQKIFLNNQQHFIECANKNIEDKMALWHQKQCHLALGQKGDIEKIISPVKEQLSHLDKKNEELEKQWLSSYSGLKKVLETQQKSVDSLGEQAKKLAMTFHSNQNKGAWGEIQLKRILELTGMLEYCDFTLQSSFEAKPGDSDKIKSRQLRPDAIIHLPQKRHIIIDAKSSNTDEGNTSLKRHIQQLSQKQYWQHDGSSADFVILFLPVESSLHYALSQDPALIDEAARKNIVLASPASLIAILKCIHMTWKQEQLQENMHKALSLSNELLDRIHTLTKHFEDIHKGLNRANVAYNRAVGTFENRILSTAKKISEQAKLNHPIENQQSIPLNPEQIRKPSLSLEDESSF